MACAISATSDTMARWSRLPSNGHGSSAPGTASSLISRSLRIPSLVTRSCSGRRRPWPVVSSAPRFCASSRRMGRLRNPDQLRRAPAGAKNIPNLTFPLDHPPGADQPRCARSLLTACCVVGCSSSRRPSCFRVSWVRRICLCGLHGHGHEHRPPLVAASKSTPTPKHGAPSWSTPPSSAAFS